MSDMCLDRRLDIHSGNAALASTYGQPECKEVPGNAALAHGFIVPLLPVPRAGWRLPECKEIAYYTHLRSAKLSATMQSNKDFLST
jgi:hypothetical protein